MALVIITSCYDRFCAGTGVPRVAGGVVPGAGARHHLVGDLVVQRLGDQPALDQLGLGPERPRPDDGVGAHLADAVEASSDRRGWRC